MVNLVRFDKLLVLGPSLADVGGQKVADLVKKDHTSRLVCFLFWKLITIPSFFKVEDGSDSEAKNKFFKENIKPWPIRPKVRDSAFASPKFK